MTGEVYKTVLGVDCIDEVTGYTLVFPNEEKFYVYSEGDKTYIEIYIEGEKEYYGEIEENDEEQVIRWIAETINYPANIIEALEKGNWRIESESGCGCYINWELDSTGLHPYTNSDACWIGNFLWVTVDGKELVLVENIQFEEMKNLGHGILPLLENHQIENADKILKELKVGDFEENKKHEEKLKRTLKDFIEGNEYKTAVYYPRGFANEYTTILYEEGTELDDEYEEIEVDEFVDLYLNKGDAVTEVYSSFVFIGD